MKKIILLFAAVAAVTTTSCTKDAFTANKAGIASLTVINAVPDLSGALLNFTGGRVNYAKDQAAVYYQSFFEYPGVAGTLPVTIVSSADTTQTIYSGKVTGKNGGLYSLYLFGQASAVQTMLMEDAIPAHKDSVSGVRFVNLSTDNQPFDVVLDGNPVAQAEFAGIAFKQVTAFKGYSCNSVAMANGGYNFDIVDASGNIVTTFFWSFTPFKNNTLVISGSVADGSLSVFQVNNF